jgi:hypothetical protein
MKPTLAQIKKFVNKHRFALGVTAATAVFIILNKRNAAAIDAFLIEHNIDPKEFWTPEA